MAEYRFSPSAQQDLDEIFDYTVTQWGLPQALNYTDLIEVACSNLAVAPQLAQDCSYIRRGYQRKSVEQHVIYFLIVNDGSIEIIRILHQRMDATRRL
jgi:toxin ParE1/3/4